VILQEYDCKCDIWSTGVLTFQILTGRFPHFEDIRTAKLPEVFRATLTQDVDWEAQWIRDAMSDGAIDFCRTLMNK
jgi:calcium-dependent protein kinase